MRTVTNIKQHSLSRRGPLGTVGEYQWLGQTQLLLAKHQLIEAEAVNPDVGSGYR